MMDNLPGMMSSSVAQRTKVHALLRAAKLEHLVDAGSEFLKAKVNSIYNIVDYVLKDRRESREFCSEWAVAEADWMPLRCLLTDCLEGYISRDQNEFLCAVVAGSDILAKAIKRFIVEESAIKKSFLPGSVEPLLDELVEGCARRIVELYAVEADSTDLMIIAALRKLLKDKERSLSDESIGGSSALHKGWKLWVQYMRAASRELEKVPVYYPSCFTLELLAQELQVGNIDDSEQEFFRGDRIYWGGRFRETTSGSDSWKLLPGLSVLLGDPGSGKTTFSKNIVVDTLKNSGRALYVRLESLSGKLECNPDLTPLESTVAVAAEGVGLFMSRLEVKEFTEHLSQGEPLVLVYDGLDEVVSAKGYEKARSLIMSLAAGGNIVLLTSRIAGYTRKWAEGVRHFYVKPLSLESRRAFALRWFESSDCTSAVVRFEEVERHPDLGEVIENPLTLGFVCMLAVEGDVPLSSGEIFDHFIDHFLIGPWREASTQIRDPSTVIELKFRAEDAAWRMANFQNGYKVVWKDVVPLLDVVKDRCDARDVRLFEIGLLQPYGILKETGDSHQLVKWIHRCVHENLVAKRMIRFLRMPDDDEWRGAFFQACLSPAWLEVVGQCYEIMEDAEVSLVDAYLREVSESADTPDGLVKRVIRHSGSRTRCKSVRSNAFNDAVLAKDWWLACRIDPCRYINFGAAFVGEGDSEWYMRLMSLALRRVCRLLENDFNSCFYLLSGHSRLPEVQSLLEDLVSVRLQQGDAVARLTERLFSGREVYSASELDNSQREALLHSVGRRTMYLQEGDSFYFGSFWNVFSEDPSSEVDPKELLRYPRLAIEYCRHYGVDLDVVRCCFGKLLDESEWAFVCLHLLRAGLNWRTSKPNVGIEQVYPRVLGCGVDESAEVVSVDLEGSRTRLGFAREILVEHSRRSRFERKQLLWTEWALVMLERYPSVENAKLLYEWHDCSAWGYVDGNLFVSCLNRQPWDVVADSLASCQDGDPWFRLFACFSAFVLGCSDLAPWVERDFEKHVERLVAGLRRLRGINEVPESWNKCFDGRWHWSYLSFDDCSASEVCRAYTLLVDVLNDVPVRVREFVLSGVSKRMYDLDVLRDFPEIIVRS